ncbi:MAG: hypothetical protein ACRDIY_02405, partial [Chloroflexota bacterium]
MDSRTETARHVQATSVGSLEITLSIDPNRGNQRTLTELRPSSGKLAREVPIVIGSLLFAEWQMRMINDPSRLVAVTTMENAGRAAREGHLVAPAAPPGGRAAGATYRVELLANGGFQVKVDEKLAG